MVFAVNEPTRHEADIKPRLRFADAKRLSGPFWTVVGVATILTLARFSEAFLILRSQNVGLPISLVPAVMVVMNIVYALAAYPAGALSDRIGRKGLLAVGMACLIVRISSWRSAHVPLASSASPLGPEHALTQGLIASLCGHRAEI